MTTFDPSLIWKVEAGWHIRDLRWVLGLCARHQREEASGDLVRDVLIGKALA